MILLYTYTTEPNIVLRWIIIKSSRARKPKQEIIKLTIDKSQSKKTRYINYINYSLKVHIHSVHSKYIVESVNVKIIHKSNGSIKKCDILLKAHKETIGSTKTITQQITKKNHKIEN
jgi:hypothetical protein